MSSIVTDSNGSTTLLNSDEQDILDEFLDQRVYDSLGTNTPINGSNGTVKLEQNQNELIDSLYAVAAAAASTTSSSSKNPTQSARSSSTGLSTIVHNKSFQQFTTTANNPIINGNNNNTNYNTNNPSPDYLYFDMPHESNFAHLQQQQHQQSSPTGSYDFNHNNDNNNSNPLSDFDFIRDELSKLKFGNHFMNPCPNSVEVPHPSYLDFSNQNSLPYKLQISNLPSYSRVETQIKLKISLSPPPPQFLLHLPQDLIAKNKFCLADPLEDINPKLKENMLYFDAYVLTSDLSKSCNICPRCIKREQKRASRRKIGGGDADDNEYIPPPPTTTTTSASGIVKNNPLSWADESMMKKALIFNCKEIVSFPTPTGLNNDTAKSLELSARIICYCRHHKEPKGFRLLFVIKDNQGQVVAKQITNPIMIMDRKKNQSLTHKDTGSLPNSIAGSSTNLQGLDQYSPPNYKKKKLSTSDISDRDETTTHGLSPTSPHLMNQLSPNSVLDESASEVQTNTDAESSRGLKRKKLSIDDSLNNSTNPMYNGSIHSGYSPVSNSDTNTSTHFYNGFGNNNNNNGKPHLSPRQAQALLGSQSYANIPLLSNPHTHNFPSIQRIIPAQGPIRGGIEVTLLGFNFRPGLRVKFGANLALATHCWSETTIVTYLPPAAGPGQVLVSFDSGSDANAGVVGGSGSSIFTYTDDTDRQLIELALQIVGLKMNGKLEDAKNIAKRIVGTDATSNNNTNGTTMAGNGSGNNNMNVAAAATTSTENGHEWFDNAHKSITEQLAQNHTLSTHQILVNLLSLVDLPNCPITIPNWSLSNPQGQTLLHLATIKGYTNLIQFLISHGAKVDMGDNQGITPLFLASMKGEREIMNMYRDCQAKFRVKYDNDKWMKDYCDLNVLDFFDEEEKKNDKNKKNNKAAALNNNKSVKRDGSEESLSGWFFDNYGKHVSKMVVADDLVDNNASDRQPEEVLSDGLISEGAGAGAGVLLDDDEVGFADAELESEDFDEFDEDDDYEDDEVDYEDDYTDDEITVSNTTINSPVEGTSSSDTATTISDTTPATSLPPSPPASPGLWRKVMNVFHSDDEEVLPAYEDLFPLGPNATKQKPKSQLEQRLNTDTTSSTTEATTSRLTHSTSNDSDTALTDSSSDDMVIKYINHPRKAVEHDKMLFLFWMPALVFILGLMFMVYVMGYRFETVDLLKGYIRNAVGHLMVGDERIDRVFKSGAASVVGAANVQQQPVGVV
ncbi:SPT23 [[Candida] subhashii]|uniref:SPT23 n=1 Tax=[Candida] subhashii TaxID=561895 RepID=A0A8J5QIJ5_9ASCO|nr:SPT23 [[Candida] subhashii]KAG7666239.1 SPT23 [[Candida] subhashii]